MNFRPLAILLLSVPRAFGAEHPEQAFPEAISFANYPPLLQPQASWNWTQSVSLGMGLSHVGRMSYSAGSRAAGFTYPSFVGSNSLVVPPVGNATVITSRTYDDGFVDLDPGTLNDGRTWHWGYQNAGQVGADSLTFHTTGSQSIRTDTPTSVPSLSSTETVGAAQVHLDFNLFPQEMNARGIQSGWLISVSALGIDDDYRSSDYSLVQRRDDYRLDYRDTFTLNGVVPPQAPYSGTAAGPGPVIPNRPDNRVIDPVLINTTQATLTNHVSSSYDTSIISIGMGPSWRYRTDDVILELAAGASVSLYDWSASQRESVFVTGQAAPVRTWRDRNSGVDANVGLFLRLAVHHQLTDRWSTNFFIQGHVASDVSFNVGPSSFDLDNKGFTLGWGIGLTF